MYNITCSGVARIFPVGGHWGGGPWVFVGGTQILSWQAPPPQKKKKEEKEEEGHHVCRDGGGVGEGQPFYKA